MRIVDLVPISSEHEKKKILATMLFKLPERLREKMHQNRTFTFSLRSVCKVSLIHRI